MQGNKSKDLQGSGDDVHQPIYPADLTPLLLSPPKMHSPNMLTFYSPYFNKNFMVESPLGNHSQVRLCSAADGGWLTTLHGASEVVLANLLTRSSEKLPPMWDPYSNMRLVSYGGDSSSQQCRRKVLGMGQIENALCPSVYNGESWSVFGTEEEEEEEKEEEEEIFPSLSTCCNPVQHKSCFYFLTKQGSLVVCDPEKPSITHLEKPQSFDVDGLSYDECYLAADQSQQGELFAVLCDDHHGALMRVLRLDEDAMEWKPVEEGGLKGRVLFIGALSSVMKATSVRRMQNKVFLPRFYGEPETVAAELTTDEQGRPVFVPTTNHSSVLRNQKDEKSSEAAAAASIMCHDFDNYDEKQRGLSAAGSEKKYNSFWVDLANDT